MFEEKMKRLFVAAGAKSDTDLADILGIKPPSVAGARKRQAVPGDWIEKIAKSYHVSADWLLFGRGTMRLAELILEPEAQVEKPVTQPKLAVQCARCAKLEVELEQERTERRELSAENRQWAAKMEQIFRENGDLRERCAILMEQQRKFCAPGGDCTTQNTPSSEERGVL